MSYLSKLTIPQLRDLVIARADQEGINVKISAFKVKKDYLDVLRPDNPLPLPTKIGGTRATPRASPVAKLTNIPQLVEGKTVAPISTSVRPIKPISKYWRQYPSFYLQDGVMIIGETSLAELKVTNGRWDPSLLYDLKDSTVPQELLITHSSFTGPRGLQKPTWEKAYATVSVEGGTLLVFSRDFDLPKWYRQNADKLDDLTGLTIQDKGFLFATGGDGSFIIDVFRQEGLVMALRCIL